MPDLSVLTAREREVFHLMRESKKVKDISVQLNIAVKTVEVHKYNLMRKLDLHTTGQVRRFAIRHAAIPHRADTPVQRETPDHPIIEGSTNP